MKFVYGAPKINLFFAIRFCLVPILRWIMYAHGCRLEKVYPSLCLWSLSTSMLGVCEHSDIRDARTLLASAISPGFPTAKMFSLHGFFPLLPCKEAIYMRLTSARQVISMVPTPFEPTILMC